MDRVLRQVVITGGFNNRPRRYVQEEKALRRVAKVLADAMVHELPPPGQDVDDHRQASAVAAAAVFSVRRVETVEPLLPNLPKSVAKVLQIDALAVDRMLVALKAIKAVDDVSILEWAANLKGANNPGPFLDTEQKRADFGEMMLGFKRVHFLCDHFDALVFELKERFCVGPSACSAASVSKFTPHP